MESAGGRSDPRPLTREEEAVKRNTDCVYFLASPLTCKKGNDCEYRHSEGARVNPRDCRFWFSGNCLNPKCLFRHPPLDGPVGNPVATSGPIINASQAISSMQLPMTNSSAYNLSKNNVPCYYFQKGACLKGDKCSFMHGPQPAVNPVVKQTQKVSAPVNTQLETTKKDAWKPKEFNNTALSLGKESAGQPVSGASSLVEGNLALENPTFHSANKSSSTSFLRPQSFHIQSEQEAGEILAEFSEFGYNKLKRPLSQQLQSSRYKNDKGVEDVFREFSPGFDVLVNNVVKVADYPHDKDGFRSKSIQGGRNMNHGDISGHHQCDPESTDWLDRDQLNGVDGDQHRTFSFSERILDKPILPVRRSAHRLRSPDGINETDLRHRLMKQRRLNSSLSVAISDSESKPFGRHEQKMQDRETHNSYRDRRSENTISGRLRGRITLSKSSSPEFASDLYGGGGRGRQRGNLSPSRTSSLQGRLGERLGRRPIEDSLGIAKNIGNQQKSRGSVNPLDFAGPRSLAELKSAKVDGSSESQSTKKIPSISSPESDGMKPSKATGRRDSEVSVEFDGPKPLSALRKRDRETRAENDGNSGFSNDRKATVEIENSSCAFEDSKVIISNPEEPEVETVVEEEGEIEEVVHISADVEQITYESVNRDAAEDEELDYADQRDGDCDYDGGDYKTEDDENVDLMNIDEVEEEEEEDDDDEDDFAKKIGLIFS